MSKRANKEKAVEALAAWRRILAAMDYPHADAVQADLTLVTGFLERVPAALPTADAIKRCEERRKVK